MQLSCYKYDLKKYFSAESISSVTLKVALTQSNEYLHYKRLYLSAARLLQDEVWIDSTDVNDYVSTQRSPGALQQGWVSKPGHAPSGV